MRSLQRCTLRGLIFAFALFSGVLADAAERLELNIDARDLPRKLLRAELRLPLPGDASQARTVALWYPKWVPGSHGPGGPVANVAGIIIEDSSGNRLDWSRTDGEVYRIAVQVPKQVAELKIRLRYIANQPTTNSMGHDVFGAPFLGVISSGAVLFYPEGASIDETEAKLSLKLPSGWQAATALPAGKDSGTDDCLKYQPVTLRTLVDSPIMCGRHRKVYDLVDPDQSSIPPHRLHVFSETPKSIELDAKVLQRLKGMVQQTGDLIGSHPFDQFDILLAITDSLPANGLEHLRSTFNILPRRAMSSLPRLKGWNRLLIPHEYLHAWCGKYRRPEKMATTDFHTPKGTELLWVYEGLTQYLGELVEARCGLMSKDEFRHRLAVEVRNAKHQQGRAWRSLADTGAASHVLRARSSSWPRLRRSQDYYMEGMLLWLEIDGLLRKHTNGSVKLDAFCQQFFYADRPVFRPKPFNRQEIVETLNSLHTYDWDGLIQRRVESLDADFDSSFVTTLGYRLEYQDAPPAIPATTFRFVSGLDTYDSLGVAFTSAGSVTDLLLESVADRAALAPGDQIVAVQGRTWSEERMKDAIRETATGQHIQLLVQHGDVVRTVQLQYNGGLRYLHLVRDNEQPDRLSRILAPLP